MQDFAGGFTLAEAPVVTVDDHLLVSDVMSGGVRRFAADGTETEPFLEKRRGIGGMARFGEGVVVSGRDLSVVLDDGSSTVLAETTDGGTAFNDLTVTPDGIVLAGMLTCEPLTGGPLTPGYLVATSGDGPTFGLPIPCNWPNGIELSPAGDLLYLADFETGTVFRSTWTGRMDLVELDPWITTPSGDADGLAVSPDGDVWVASGSGGSVLRYAPTGELRATIEVPDAFVSSCCLWPAHERLVVATGNAVYVHDLT